MRLTLRTLLAFRDNVLDPGDAQQLEARIRDSATARSISNRIDAVMANSRLSPMPADAREFGLDANDVACFLDDTISHDRLPEMERLCLENNALLAEVAGCHQILARTIAIPVNVSPKFRERICQLKFGGGIDAIQAGAGHRLRRRRMDPGNGSIPHAHLYEDGSSGAIDASNMHDDVPPSFETRDALQGSLSHVRRPNKNLGGTGIELDDSLGHQVPEYLRGTDRQWAYSAIKLLVLFALLGMCAFVCLGPKDRLARLLDRKPVLVKPPLSDTLTDRGSGMGSASGEAGASGEARAVSEVLAPGMDRPKDSTIVTPTEGP